VITKDIREGCTVMNEQAEKLKIKFGSAMADEIVDNRIITIPGFKGRDHKEISEKNLARIIQARVEEIFDYVLWEIRRSGYDNKLIAGMVLTGGGSLLKHIDLLSEYHTGLPTRVGQPIEHLAHGYSSQLASPIFATAVGLLKHTIDNYGDKANYVEEFKRITEEPRFYDPYSAAQSGMKKDIKSNSDDNDDSDDDSNVSNDGERKKGLFNKLFTLTKDFFETVPDSEF